MKSALTAKILVIDDDPTIQLVIQKILQKQGYDVILASDGQQGIELATQIQPALIICDWIMPVLDGLEVCRRVRANPALATTFFILLTSRGEVSDRVTGLNTGADDFLSKPVEISELQARVRAALRLHQLSQDLQTQNNTWKQNWRKQLPTFDRCCRRQCWVQSILTHASFPVGNWAAIVLTIFGSIQII